LTRDQSTLTFVNVKASLEILEEKKEKTQRRENKGSSVSCFWLIRKTTMARLLDVGSELTLIPDAKFSKKKIFFLLVFSLSLFL